LIHSARDLIDCVIYSTWEWRGGRATMAAAQPMEKIRPAAVAGSFYPADPGGLRAQVDDLMAAAPAYTGAPPTALIAPHAGYIYSGAVAAAAFAGLRDRAPTARRVVVIGPAHYVALRGIAIPTADAFETPLGRVPVARGALATIADLTDVRMDDAAHAPEHALEVELPFLQMLLGSFALVPLLVGAADPRDVSEILARLWDEPETLIVVSSDLSHFLEYAAAQRRDAATAAAIECLDWAALGPGDACGALPIAGLLQQARPRRLKARRLALCNSGDTAGSHDSVVGYGAWAFSE
jgi:MEMO1 family protein